MTTHCQHTNWIARRYPLTKLWIALVFAMSPIICISIWHKALALLCLFLLAALSGVFIVFVKRTWASVGVLFLLLLVIQSLFGQGETVLAHLAGFTIKKEGLIFGVQLGLTIFIVGGALIWFFTLTPAKDLVLALEKLGLNRKASYVILSTLHMVPELKNRSQIIMNAQRSRGVETEGNFFNRAKAFIPTLIPLVLSSIQGTEERILTLEARGFSANIKGTHLYDLTRTRSDLVISCICVAVICLMIVGRIVLWLY